METRVPGWYWCKDPGMTPEVVHVRSHPAWDDGPYVVHRFGVSGLREWQLLHPEMKWEGPLVCGLTDHTEDLEARMRSAFERVLAKLAAEDFMEVRVAAYKKWRSEHEPTS